MIHWSIFFALLPQGLYIVDSKTKFYPQQMKERN